MYQGENDIRGQIELGGAGLYAQDPANNCTGVNDASQNCDKPNSVKNTFEDIDGLEVIAAEEGLFVIIQEDSGNDLGERMFISSVFEHEDDGKELTYYFMAMSGGEWLVPSVLIVLAPEPLFSHTPVLPQVPRTPA